jgi:MYXO-CTERM domain-containing protein
VYFDGALAGTAPVDGTGQFDFEPVADLTSGLHHVAAATRLGAAESAKSPTVTFTVNAPTAGEAPRFLSRAAPFAFCGQPYAYSSTGEPSVAGGRPMVFSLGGEALPAGLTVDPGTGALAWTPVRAQEGVIRFELIATGPGGTAAETIEVAVLCRDEQLGVGCGCSTGAGSGVVLLLLVGLARRRRASR